MNPERDISEDGGTSSRNEATLEAKHKVFLSHSGAQKGFVEQLCLDLERCDRYPFFDKRRHSLGIGCNFPKHIFQAIRQCQVGVLILSEEYFTRSKWPMLEMVAMVESKKLNPELVIMPVFLGISRDQCRSVDNYKRWLPVWIKWAQEDPRINVKKWEEALLLFGPTNSLSYNDTLGEVKFREEIVEAICERVRPETRWDDSHIRGGTRICKIIREKVGKTQVCGIYGVRVVGLYGVGGIGKTTICKALCTDYFTEFRGRVAHVELESGSAVELIRGVLRKLTDMRHEVLAGFDTGECSTRLKEEVHKRSTFLAIDNVSDSGEVIVQARTYLTAGFKQGSVVVVTARSMEQLMSVGIEAENCLEMPKLDSGEARSLLLSQVPGVPDERSKEDEDLVQRCVELCRFLRGDESRFDYLPLALKVLGVQLGCVGYDPKQWVSLVEQEPDTFNQLRERENPIFAFLRRSFDALRNEDQLLFMDAVLYFPKSYLGGIDDEINIFEWLSMVHRTSVQLVKLRLEALKRKSVIEAVSERIGIHDLWREFAKEETKEGQLECRRWVYVNDDDRSEFDESDPPGNRWGKLKRMGFVGSGVESFKSVNLHYCSNVTVLHVRGYLDGIEVLDLSALKYLKSLLWSNWQFGDTRVEVRGLGLLKSLGFLVWEDAHISSACMEDIGRLTSLRFLRLSCNQCSKMPDLTNLTLLQVVEFDTEGEVSEVFGLSYKFTRLERLKLRLLNESVMCRCYGIGNIIALQELEIEGSLNLEEFFNVQKLTNLRRLTIDDCRSKELPGLGDLVALNKLHLCGCDCDCDFSKLGALRSSPNMCKLTNLQKLDISHNKLISALHGLGDAVSLQELRASHCSELRELPDMRNLTNLRELDISWCSVTTVPGLGNLVALQVLRAQHCTELSEVPDMLKLASLKTLDLRWCSLKAVPGLGELVALEHFFAHHCAELVELPDLSKLTNLRLLYLRYCCSLKALPPLSGLSSLQSLKGDSHALEKSKDLHKLPKLLKLKVSGWGSQGLPGANNSATLEFLTIRDCQDLDALTGLPSLPHLQWLMLKRCSFRIVSSLANLTALLYLEIFFCCELDSLPDLHHLTRLRIVDNEHVASRARSMSKLRTFINIGNLPKLEYLECRNLPISDLPDLSNFPQLIDLEVCNCEGLRTVTSTGPLPDLESLTVDGCGSLRALPDLSRSTNLHTLVVRGCGLRLTEPDTQDCETTSWPRVEWEPIPRRM